MYSQPRAQVDNQVIERTEYFRNRSAHPAASFLQKGVKPSTWKGYASRLKNLLKILKAMGALSPPAEILGRSPGGSAPLFAFVAGNVTPQHFQDFCEYRESFLEGSLDNFRSALVFAQQLAGGPVWAGHKAWIRAIAAAERRIKWEAATVKIQIPRGSIGWDTWRSMEPFIRHPRPSGMAETKRKTRALLDGLRCLLGGAFRIGELTKLRALDVNERGVWLFNPKHLQATNAEMMDFKEISLWPSGRVALRILLRRAAKLTEGGTPHDLIFPCSEWNRSDIAQAIHTAAGEAGLPRDLKWSPHSFRHGGFRECLLETEAHWSPEVRADVLRSEVQIAKKYYLSNEERREAHKWRTRFATAHADNGDRRRDLMSDTEDDQ